MRPPSVLQRAEVAADSLRMPEDRLKEIEARIAALAPGYLERRSADVAQLRTSNARGDWTSIGAIGHDLHGAGACYGFPWISEIGSELEAAAERQDAEKVAELVDALEAVLAREGAIQRGQRSR
jgi:HPt (histidine-containing phosphotransfer) domain-containing protein